MSDNSSSNEDHEEIQEFNVDPIDQVELLDLSIESQSVKKRGRKRIPEQWTGVINLERDDVELIKMRDLATDLMLTQGIPDPVGRQIDSQWKPIFLSKTWIKDYDEITLDKFRLDSEAFLKYGEDVSQIRERLQEAADYSRQNTNLNP